MADVYVPAVSATLRCWTRWIITPSCSWISCGVIRRWSSWTVWTTPDRGWLEPRSVSRGATESSRADCGSSRSVRHPESLDTVLYLTHMCVHCMCRVSGSQGHTGGEDVLFLRLYLLQSVLAYHEGNKNQASHKLKEVNALNFNYYVCLSPKELQLLIVQIMIHPWIFWFFWPFSDSFGDSSCR